MKDRIDEYFFGFGVPDAVSYFYERAGQLLRNSYGIPSLADRLPAHLTVKATFKMEESVACNLGSRFDSVVARNRMRAVPGYLGGLSNFDEEVIHISVNGERVQSAIKLFLEELRTGFDLPPRGFEGQNPHITIARHLVPESYGGAMEALHELECPHGETTFDTLKLWRRNVHGNWDEIHHIGLARAYA